MMSIRIFFLKNWSRRRVLIGLSVVVIGVVVGRALVTGYHEATASKSRQANGDFGGNLQKWETKPRYSDELNKYEAWLLNDLIRQRTPWTMKQVRPLLERLNHPPDEKYYEDFEKRVASKDPTLTWRDFEPDMFFDDTAEAVENRFRRDEPMDPDVRAALKKRFVELMQSPRPRIRDKFQALVQYARMPRDPAVRAKMVSLYGDHAMDHFDKLERLYAKGMLAK